MKKILYLTVAIVMVLNFFSTCIFAQEICADNYDDNIVEEFLKQNNDYGINDDIEEAVPEATSLTVTEQDKAPACSVDIGSDFNEDDVIVTLTHTQSAENREYTVSDFLI